MAARARDLAGKRVLVTGASGFLGSHLVECLARQGAVVAALARSEGKLAAVEPRSSFLYLRCDLSDAVQAREAIAGFSPQILYHFAAHPDGKESFHQASAAIQSNLSATLHVLDAFRLCGGELFVYGDSCKVYGNCAVPYRSGMPMRPTSSYAIAKAAGWEMCQLYSRLYGIPTLSVRPTLIYGSRQGFNIITYVVRCVLEGRPEIYIDGGDQTRDPLFIDDAMNAFLAVAAAGRRLSGSVINIGGQNEIRVVDLARLVVETMDSRIPVVADPRRIRPTEMNRSFCDNAEAFELLGWRSVTSLREGLVHTIPTLTGASGCLRVALS